MIEIVVKKYLDGHLSVPSFFEHETTMPKEFVIVEKTRGANKNYFSIIYHNPCQVLKKQQIL